MEIKFVIDGGNETFNFVIKEDQTIKEKYENLYLLLVGVTRKLPAKKFNLRMHSHLSGVFETSRTYCFSQPPQGNYCGEWGPNKSWKVYKDDSVAENCIEISF